MYEARLGIEKTRLLMRESVYWPNSYKDRDDGELLYSLAGEPDGHRQQPLLAHDVPSFFFFVIQAEPYIDITPACAASDLV